MTSIAAYLASLAGGTPLEGQKAAQTGTTGAAGLFAALLSSVQGDANPDAAVTEGEQTLLGLLASPDTQQIDPALLAQLNALAENDPELAQLLAQELPVAEGDITATITPAEIPTNEALATDSLVAADGDGSVAPHETQTESEIEPPVLPVDSNLAGDPDTTDPDAPLAAPVVQPAVDTEAESGTPAVPAQPQGESAAGDTAARNTGLANAFQHASETGQRNGLQNANANVRGVPAASAQTPQATQPAQAAAQQTTPIADAESTPAAGRTETSEANSARPQFADTPRDAQSGRSAPPPNRPRATVQRILDAGNGKSVIQIHERAGGEPVGTANPPTLTVNVQASAASPGPASPNTPHVPVSALAVHIAQQHNKGARRFDIMMDPPELGRIEVRLDVARDGQVTTHLVVERSETLDLLQRDARQLERALQGAGLNTSEDGMKFSLKDQGLAQGDQDDSQKGEDADAKSGAMADEATETNQDTRPRVRYMATTGLDIRI